MELGPPNHNGDGLLEPNSTIVVYMDPLGKPPKIPTAYAQDSKPVTANPKIQRRHVDVVPKPYNPKTPNPKTLKPQTLKLQTLNP